MLDVRRARPSNAVRWDKAKNPIFWVGANLGVRRHVPDYRLTNGICSLDYCLWWYWIPLAFNRDPILTLPHIVASAVTIGVRATRHSIGGPKMLKPLTHFRRNVRELPAVHCDGSGRATGWIADQDNGSSKQKSKSHLITSRLTITA